MDEFDRALNAGPGEPAREAVEGALGDAAKRMGVTGDMYEWVPKGGEETGLDEDDKVEAWLICQGQGRGDQTCGGGADEGEGQGDRGEGASR